jgi:hypothetical protein
MTLSCRIIYCLCFVLIYIYIYAYRAEGGVCFFIGGKNGQKKTRKCICLNIGLFAGVFVNL